MIDVAILTEQRFTTCDPRSAYVSQVILEDSFLFDHLLQRGVRVERIDWADASVDWSKIGCAIFRSTWNYHDHIERFTQWLDHAGKRTRLINPCDIIRWTLDKRYLVELAKKGVNAVPTLVFEKGSAHKLSAVADEFDGDFVIKPAIAAGGKETYRLSKADAAQMENKFAALLSAQAMVAQPFQSSVLEKGELSFITIGGKYTHAVRKIPAGSEFRIHEKYGGRVLTHEASSEQIAFAESAVKACPGEPVYARVDAVEDARGRLSVMEIELFEPELFFRFGKHAAEKLASAVLAQN
jgi:glutathione synthase/RimK-type ligase-like ATP-grasp enzyme